MKLLVDTHALLWFATGDRRLTAGARRIMEDTSMQLLLSAVSVWEIVLKFQAGKLELQDGPEDFLRQALVRCAMTVLPIQMRHVMRVLRLPDLHRDPFDRMLIAQSQEENIPILTRDPAIRTYPVKCVWN